MGIFVNIDDGEQTHNVQLSSNLYVVGRSSRCDLTIKDELISGKHLGLYVSKEGKAIIKDLESTNGTLINGIKIQESYLCLGDEVAIGNIKIRLNEEKLREKEKALHKKETSNQTQIKFVDLHGKVDNSQKRGVSAMKKYRDQDVEKQPLNAETASVQEFRQYKDEINAENPPQEEDTKAKNKNASERKNLQKRAENIKKDHSSPAHTGDKNHQQYEPEKTTGFTNVLKVEKQEKDKGKEKISKSKKNKKRTQKEDSSLVGKILNFLSSLFS